MKSLEIKTTSDDFQYFLKSQKAQDSQFDGQDQTRKASKHVRFLLLYHLVHSEL